MIFKDFQSNPFIFERSLQILDAWIENEAFKGWDPYDGLNSPLLKKLTGTNRKIGQYCVQLMKNSPINFRPFLGVPKGYNPKGMGLFLGTYLRKYQRTHSKTDLQKIQFFSDWLINNRSTGWEKACWGYNFDWPNRDFFAPAGTPTIVNTAFIGLAFLDDYLIRRNKVSLEISVSACEFILNNLNRCPADENETCLSYTPIDTRGVFNANILGAWLLAEVYLLAGNKEMAETSLSCLRFTINRQEEDGSWPYGVASYDQWVDSYHTGYVLVGLNRISRLLGRQEFYPAIEHGYKYWKNNFFLGNSIPKYYPNRIFPFDAHVISQGILTFLEFSKQDSEALEKAFQLAKWGIDQFQHPKGFFFFQQNRFYKNRIPYMRWSQAWMQRALTTLLDFL